MKFYQKNVLITLLFIFWISLSANAQLTMPEASPPAMIAQKIGLTGVTVDYSRPSTKGREIFGTLVPYGEVWRTGANASTKLNFSTEVEIEGKKIPAGTYALYTIPGQSEWTVILSKNTELWGSIGYNPEEDIIRFKVQSSITGKKYETFQITFNDMKDNSAFLTLKWENTRIDFKISTEVDPIVMAEIQEKVIDANTDNPSLLYMAARYYYEHGKDLDDAYKWIVKSVDRDPKYWTMHLKAKIELRLDMMSEALKSAERSIEMADKAGNFDYVRLNERLIKSIN